MRSMFSDPNYDPTTGYKGKQNQVIPSSDKAIAIVKSITRKFPTQVDDSPILDIGFGSGYEPLNLSREFNLPVISIDVTMSENLPDPGDREIFYSLQSAMELGFEAGSFSFIYCFHVLEHVKDPEKVLREMRRVIKPGGFIFIGFPNKNRFVSYISTGREISLKEKILWNLNDLVFKLQGRFENELGAHAGFSNNEFLKMAGRVFETVTPVRNEYYFQKYPKWRSLISLMINLGLQEVIFPSNYYICYRKHA